MKKIIAIIAVMCCIYTGMAQTVTIIDNDSGEPIEFATLISHQPKIYAITNSNGKADITPFKDAEAIQIRSMGHKSTTTTYRELEGYNFKLTLPAANFALDEVVVSATRWQQTSDHIPSKIINISKDDVAFQNPQTAADLLGVSGKVFVQKSQQGGGSPMIRGFATNRLLYTVDGVRMNTAIFRGGNIQNVINLDPFAIEATEVLFGPGSVIYGSDAIGGVMSFQTLKPQFSTSDKLLLDGNAAARYSSANNEKTGHFDVNVGWKKWAFVSSITSWDYDDLRQGRHGPNEYLKPFYVSRQNGEDQVSTQEDPLLQQPSGYTQLNLMQKIRFKPNEKWDFEYGFHYSETSQYGRYDRHNRMRDGLPRYGQWDYGPQQWLMNNLNITHTSVNTLYDEASLRLAQQSFEESRISRNFNDPIRENRIEEVEAYSLNLDFIKDINEKNTLFYGIEYVLNDINSTGINEDIEENTFTRGPSRYPEASWQSIAAYVNNEYNISEKITLLGGLRYNHFMFDATFDTTFYPFPFEKAELNNGSLTGSIGAVYRPSTSWVINANFGTAFRSPNVDDIGKVFDSEPGAVTVPNPDLKAEYAYNFDLGATKIINDNIKIDITGYYTILDNALVRRDFQLAGRDSIQYDGVLSRVQAIQNAAVAHVYGVQAGAEIKLPAGFNFSTDINWQKGEEELDDGSTSPSRHAAPFFGVSRLSFKAKKLTMQLYTEYQGKRKFEDLAVEERSKDEIYAKDENGNNYAPSWYTLNLKAQYPFYNNFIVSAGIENITDQRYRPYSSGLSGPGRNFILSVRTNF